MRSILGGDPGWLALPFILAVGVAYIAILSWVLGKSQRARLEDTSRQDTLGKAA